MIFVRMDQGWGSVASSKQYEETEQGDEQGRCKLDPQSRVGELFLADHELELFRGSGWDIEKILPSESPGDRVEDEGEVPEGADAIIGEQVGCPENDQAASGQADSEPRVDPSFRDRSELDRTAEIAGRIKG